VPSPSRIRTPRAELRRFTLADLPCLLELESDPEVVRWTGLRQVQSTAEIAARLQRTLDEAPDREPLGVWGAWDHLGADGFVGWLMLVETTLSSPELGFMVPRRVWGRGWATHLVEALLHHGHQQLSIRRIVARTDEENTASRRVLHKLGFVTFQPERPEPATCYLEHTSTR